MKTSRMTVWLMSGLLWTATGAEGARVMSRGGFGGGRGFAGRSSFAASPAGHGGGFAGRQVFMPRGEMVHHPFAAPRHFYHPRSGLIFVNPYPSWYPAAVYPDYPFYGADYGYDGAYADSAAPAYVPGAGSYFAGYAATPAPDYVQLGHDWAQDLRQDVATWDQFVAYLKTYILRAAATARDDFYRGFLAAYGVNGGAALAKGVREASGRPAPAPAPATAGPAAAAAPAATAQNHAAK